MRSSTSSRATAPTTHHAAATTSVKIGAGLAVIVVLAAGVLLWGRIASTETAAMVLTGAWFAAVLAVGALVAVRRRDLAPALAVGYVVAVLAAFALLVVPRLGDRAVDEQVATAAPARSAADAPGTGGDDAPAGDDRSEDDPVDRSAQVGGERDTAPARRAPADAGERSDAQAPPENVELGAGRFTALAHPGKGRATVIELAAGGRVLTLTNFETDPGPDLRVYLTEGDPARGEDIGAFVDLGALKGNVGDQQYEIPDDVDFETLSTAVVWCRAFAVGFTSAAL